MLAFVRGEVRVIVDEAVSEEVLGALSVVDEVYGLSAKVERSDLSSFITKSMNRRRGQVDALELVRSVEGLVPEVGLLIVIVADDIYVNGFNFCFGLAYKRSAVVSTYRLRHQELNTYIARVSKEVSHELGHLLGLNHCVRRDCVMYFSNSVEDTDNKGFKPCDRCRALILS